MWGAGAALVVPAGCSTAGAVVPAVVLAGGGVLAGWCRPCLVGVPAGCVCCCVYSWLLGGFVYWLLVMERERKE